MSHGKTCHRSLEAGHLPAAGNPASILARAIALLRQGQLDAAEAHFRLVLAALPQHPEALQFLGVIALQQGRGEAAAELLQRAVNLAPQIPAWHCNLGLALQQLGRSAAALACYERALVLRPAFAEALNNRGNALRELDRLDEAATSYQGALRIRPDFVEALYNLGLTQLARQQPASAIASLARCLRLAPDHLGALGQYGIALMAMNDPGAALACFATVVAGLPGDAEAHHWRGNALLALRQPAAAIDSYRRALAIRPDIPEAHYNLGNVLLDQGRQDEAIAAYDRALALRPDYPEACYNRGGALQELGRYGAAAEVFAGLQERAPGHRYALGKLFHCRQFAGDWRARDENVVALEQSAANDCAQDLPFSFLAVSAEPALQLRCARAYTAGQYPPSATPLAAAPGYRHPRIRLAYVSADFGEHAVSYLLAGVFEAHDRQRFDVRAFSLKPQEGSAMGARVAAACEQFIDVSRMRDEEVAELMRRQEIDIAVDLTGYTQGNRTGIFARRPAPVQVNYLGFPATMGADYIDYIIADRFVIPDHSRRHYAEQVVILPDCFQGNDGWREMSARTPARSEVGLPESAFVFCAFNNTYKLNPRFFAIWMRLLAGVPGSVLWLASDAADVRARLREEARQRGVDPARLVFSPRIRYADHLARLPLADLFLDTLPFNAGTTASDALRAGLPVLTCASEAFAARMAGSLLQAVGLPELVAGSIGEYEALAGELARDAGRLALIRQRLRHNRTSHPLFDTARFTGYLEEAYIRMQQRCAAGLPPAPVVVERRAESSGRMVAG